MAQLKWQGWRKTFGGVPIFPAVATVSGMTALTKVAGAVKVIVIARYYGISDDLDAYLVAFLIPSFAADVMAAAIAPTLIPAYMAARQQEGSHCADRLAGSFHFAVLAGCAVLVCIIAALAEPIVGLLGSGFPAAKLDLTRSLTVVMAPIVLFAGMGSVWRAILNAHGEFAAPAATFAITPAVIVLAVAMSGAVRDGWMLALATVVGSALEAVAAGVWIRIRAFRASPRWSGLDGRLRQAAVQYWPIFAASLIFGASAYVHQSIAGSLTAGSVSALNYGYRLPALLLALGPAALGTAVLPHFSELAAREQWVRLRAALMSPLLTMTLAALAIAAVAFLVSADLVRLFLEHGRFSARDTEAVVAVQKFYLLQIPLAIPAAMLVRLFSSLQANRYLLMGAAISLGVNSVFGVVLSRSIGVSGLALASTLAALVYVGYLSFAVWRNKVWRAPNHAA